MIEAGGGRVFALDLHAIQAAVNISNGRVETIPSVAIKTIAKGPQGPPRTSDADHRP
jgi:hypothetical protein